MYELTPVKAPRKLKYPIIVLILGLLCVVIISVFFVSRFTRAPEVTGSPGWISGVETCPDSKEYGQLVAPVTSLYPIASVDPLNRLALMPHGAKIEIFDNSDNDMIRIRYNGQFGYVQSLHVVRYNPKTGTQPDKTSCY